MQHAIVNFTQFEFLGFVPNMPYLINGVPPTDPNMRITEEQILGVWIRIIALFG